MFWDKVATLYDFFVYLYNGKANKQICEAVAMMMDAPDRVLECACGTGMLSQPIGQRCRELVATDYSTGMLKQTSKKCKKLPNVVVRKENIMQLTYEDSSIDKVVAGNVIHLLDDPKSSLQELARVCKVGGKVIIPTYVNLHNTGKPRLFVRILEKFGAGFRNQFSYEAYQAFFLEAGYSEVVYQLVKGKMACAIAVIKKN